MEIHSNHPDVIAIAKKAYPDYNGKKFSVVVASTVDVRSYWEGGSKSTFVFVRFDNSTGTIEVPQQSAYDPKIAGADAVPLQPGMACVEHAIFCGKDVGCKIHVHVDNAPRYLPPPTMLSEDESIVLYHTKSFTNTGGYRFQEAHRVTGITRERWEAATVACQSRKLLDKRGAITGDGRNALGSKRY